ncbi:helix-turn-helix domain-containing protein [Vibrio maritimus]
MDELISTEVVICTLILMGAIQAALYSLSMFRLKQSYLALWLALFSLEVGSKGLLYLDAVPIWSQWFGYWFSFDLLYGPLLLLWVVSLTQQKSLSKWHILHFLPALWYGFLTLPEALNMPPELRAERIFDYFNQSVWVSYSPETMSLLSGVLWQPFVYVLLTLAHLFRKKEQLELKSFHWLLTMLLLHVVMWCLVIFGAEKLPWALPLVFLASYFPATVWVNSLAWLSISYLQFNVRAGGKSNSSDLGTNEQNSLTPLIPDAIPEVSCDQKPTHIVKAKKYLHTRLEESQRVLIADKLKELMERGAYTRSRLTLGEVAEQVGVAPHHVSQVINEHCQCPFSDFVNKYRLQAIKSQLLDSKKSSRTILEVALANGFSSKTRFNAAFKKETGLTPSQYRKQKGLENCDVG